MGYSTDVLLRVWEEATSVATHDPKIWRKDAYGAWMISFLYGDRTSPFGWEIFEEDGSRAEDMNQPRRLQAMQWENCTSRIRGESAPVVRSSGERNIHSRTDKHTRPRQRSPA